jgi:hypothetical protein
VISNRRCNTSTCFTLERLEQICDLLANPRLLLIAQDFRRIPGGVLEQFMQQEVMVKFMAPKLNQVTLEASQLNVEDQSLFEKMKR